MSRLILRDRLNLNVECQIGRLGGRGSDYASFLQHVGVPVIDIRFGNGDHYKFAEFFMWIIVSMLNIFFIK